VRGDCGGLRNQQAGEIARAAERSHQLTVLGDLLATVLETGQGRLVLLRGEGREDRFRIEARAAYPAGPVPVRDRTGQVSLAASWT
jgi:hypothetical protein